MNVCHAETEVLNLPGLRIHEPSATPHEGALYCLVEGDGGWRLAVLAPAGSAQLAGFAGEHSARGENTLLLGPLSAENAAALRSRLAWLRPTVLGLRTAVGLGDRLGLATPGHLRAVRAAGGHLAPLPAQQSIREMSRTGRSPQQVMDDAMWGVFAEGWRSGFGADADHLKTAEDVDRCLSAGYTFYTFDPGEHVDNAAETAPLQQLRARLEAQLTDRA